MRPWLLALLCLTACDEEPTATFPSIDVARLDGGQDRLPGPGELQIVNIWATWCGPCRAEMPSLQRLADSGITVHGIAFGDDPAFAREYLRETGIDFARHSDPDKRLRQVLDLPALPVTFVLAADGRILERIEGARDWDSPRMMAKLRSGQ